jgi:hypothetical protein
MRVLTPTLWAHVCWKNCSAEVEVENRSSSQVLVSGGFRENVPIQPGATKKLPCQYELGYTRAYNGEIYPLSGDPRGRKFFVKADADPLPLLIQKGEEEAKKAAECVMGCHSCKKAHV